MNQSQEACVLLSAFADEAGYVSKSQGNVPPTPREMLAVAAGIGLLDFVPRFHNFGTAELPDVRGLLALTEADLEQIRLVRQEFGFECHCLGTPIGKGVRLTEEDDGSGNRWIAPQEYFEDVVLKAEKLCGAFGARMVRGFSFHHPQGTNSADFIEQAAARLRPIVQHFAEHQTIYACEIETNLVGDTAANCVALAQAINNPWFGLIYDPGNITSQGDDLLDAWRLMNGYVVEIHAKHYIGKARRGEFVDENALKWYAPVSEGSGALSLDPVFGDLSANMAKYAARVARAGIQGFPITLEPHVKGGGKFGGISGPDGLGVALRALCAKLDQFRIPYRLRGWEDVKKSRGF